MLGIAFFQWHVAFSLHETKERGAGVSGHSVPLQAAERSRREGGEIEGKTRAELFAHHEPRVVIIVSPSVVDTLWLCWRICDVRCA